jgi:hypothetical protein
MKVHEWWHDNWVSQGRKYSYVRIFTKSVFYYFTYFAGLDI